MQQFVSIRSIKSLEVKRKYHLRAALASALYNADIKKASQIGSWYAINLHNYAPASTIASGTIGRERTWPM